MSRYHAFGEAGRITVEGLDEDGVYIGAEHEIAEIEQDVTLRTFVELDRTSGEAIDMEFLTKELTVSEPYETYKFLFVIGPLTRGTFGEVIGFPQITTQPRQVASYISALIEAAHGTVTRTTVFEF